MTAPSFVITYKARKFEIRHMGHGWMAGEVREEPEPIMFTFHALGGVTSPDRAFKDIIRFLEEEF